MANKLLLLLSFLFLTSSLISMTSEATSKYGNVCSACNYRRRSCKPDCLFRPYFPRDQPEKFKSVQRIYGFAKVHQILKETTGEQRDNAMRTIQFQADLRNRFPLEGAPGYIQFLKNKVTSLEAEHLRLLNQLNLLKSATTVFPNTAFPASAAITSLNPASTASFSPVPTAAAATFHPGFTAGEGEPSSSGFGVSSSNRTNHELDFLDDERGFFGTGYDTWTSLELAYIQQVLSTPNDPPLRSLTATANAFNPGGSGESSSSSNLTNIQGLDFLYDGRGLFGGTGYETEETKPSSEITDVQQPLHTTNDPSLRSLTATENDNNENATVDLLPTPESASYNRRNDDGNTSL